MISVITRLEERQRQACACVLSLGFVLDFFLLIDDLARVNVVFPLGQLAAKLRVYMYSLRACLFLCLVIDNVLLLHRPSVSLFLLTFFYSLLFH